MTPATVAPPPPVAAPELPAPVSDMVYFVMVDRFANGDPSNDGQIDLADPQAFHGGDLQGVIDHLDELQMLGARTLWLSPIFKMRTEKINEWGAYHGYWVNDLWAVEPRFGDEDTLRRLADGLHERGMRLVLDMVYNHTDYDAPLRAEHPDWFHAAVDIEDWDDPTQLVERQVHGLPDLAQENPAVARYLTDVSLHWVDCCGVDGFRIDAVRHMPIEFLANLNDALDAHVDGGFWTLGEDFQGDPAKLARTWRDGHFDAVFDFPLRYAMIDTICHDAPVGRLAGVLSADRFYDDPSRLVTFLDNHDLPRLATECGDDPRKVDQALAFLFTARGTPAVSYGTEAMLTGAEEPANRADMPWDTLSSGAYASPIPALEQLRDVHVSLREGRTWMLHLDADRFAYARVTPDEAVVIVMNHGEQPWPFAVPPAFWKLGGVVRIVSASPGGAMTAGTFDPPWPLLETAGKVVAEADGLEIIFFRPAEAGAYAGVLDSLDAVGDVTVTVHAEVPELGAGETVRVVGAAPELGAWDPARGVAGESDKLGQVQASFTVPAGVVLAWKLVRVGADGAIRWEEGGDRTVLVPREGLVLDAVWDQR